MVNAIQSSQIWRQRKAHVDNGSTLTSQSNSYFNHTRIKILHIYFLTASISSLWLYFHFDLLHPIWRTTVCERVSIVTFQNGDFSYYKLLVSKLRMVNILDDFGQKLKYFDMAMKTLKLLAFSLLTGKTCTFQI